MLKITIVTSESIFTVGVTQQEALMLYQGVYQPKTEYQPGQTFLTNKQVKTIESTALPKVIAKYAYNRSIALDKRGGSKNRCDRVLFLQKHNQSNKNAAIPKN